MPLLGSVTRLTPIHAFGYCDYQFGLHYQLRPVAILVVDPAASEPLYMSNKTAPLPAITAGDTAAEAGVPVRIVRLQRDAATTAILPGSAIALDASASYDPDGEPVMHAWKVREVFSAGLGSVATLSAVAEDSTTVTPAAPGVAQVTVTVTDPSGAKRDASLWLWLDEPPVAVVASADSVGSLPAQPAPVANGEWPRIHSHGVVGGATSVTLDGTASWDREGSPLQGSWSVVPGSVQPRPGVSASSGSSSSVAVGSPVGSTLTAVLTSLPAGFVATVQLAVTSQDVAATTDLATAVVELNALPVIDLEPLYVLRLPTSSITLDLATSYDLDGTIVRRSWTFTPVSPASLASTVVVTPLGSGEVTSITVSNITTLSEVVITVELEDNDGGVSSSGNIRVVFKNPSVAIASLPALAQHLTSPPRWTATGMTPLTLDGSSSYDADGLLSAYAWSVTTASAEAGGSQGALLASAGIQNPDRAVAALAGGYTAGDYEVKLTVTDSAGIKVSDTAPVRVLLVVDVQGASDQGVVAVPTSVLASHGGNNVATLTAAPAVHPDVRVASYNWTLVSWSVPGAPADCVPSITNAGSSSSGELEVDPRALLSLCGRGEYDVQLSVAVLDESASASSPTFAGILYSALGSVRVVVQESPVAVIDTAPLGVAVQDASLRTTVLGRSIAVSATGSSDPDGTLAAFAWAASPAGTVVTFDAPSAAATTMRAVGPGYCDVTLTVTDNAGATTSSTFRLWVMATAVAATVAPPLTRAVSVWPAGVSVAFDGSNSTAADGAVASFAWAVSATSAVGTTPSAATAAHLDSSGAAATFSGTPLAADYTVTVTATGPGPLASAPTGAANAIVRVLASASMPQPRISVAVGGGSAPLAGFSAALLQPDVQVHASATQVALQWNLVAAVDLAGQPLSCGSSPSVVAEGGVVPLALQARLQGGLCGTGDYTVTASLSAQDSAEAAGTVYAGGAVLQQVMHIHRRPVATAALHPDSAAATFAVPGADGVFITHVGQASTLRLSGAGSSDDEGIASMTWQVAAAAAGDPTTISDDASASSGATAQVVTPQPDADGRAVTLQPVGAGKAWVTLTVTDSEGASTSSSAGTVMVFATSADAAAYLTEAPPTPGAGGTEVVTSGLSDTALVLIIAAAGIALLVIVVVVAAVVRRRQWEDAKNVPRVMYEQQDDEGDGSISGSSSNDGPHGKGQLQVKLSAPTPGGHNALRSVRSTHAFGAFDQEDGSGSATPQLQAIAPVVDEGAGAGAGAGTGDGQGAAEGAASWVAAEPQVVLSEAAQPASAPDVDPVAQLVIHASGNSADFNATAGSDGTPAAAESGAGAQVSEADSDSDSSDDDDNRGDGLMRRSRTNSTASRIQLPPISGATTPLSEDGDAIMQQLFAQLPAADKERLQ